MGIPLDKAELLGTLLEGILYGFSLLTFGGAMWQLFFRRTTRKVNRIMLTIACLLLVFSTAHLVIDIIRIMEALILYRDTYPGGPVAFLADVSQWTFVSKNYVYTTQTLLGDLVILYRCYAIWRSKYVMVLPVILWCGAGVTGFGAAVVASQSSVFGDTLTNWITAFYAITFSSNISVTILLAWRIWHVDQKAASLRIHRSLTLITGWICFSYQSYAHYVVHDMIVPIISIMFDTVIICVGLVYRADDRQMDTHSDIHLQASKDSQLVF